MTNRFKSASNIYDNHSQRNGANKNKGLEKGSSRRLLDISTSVLSHDEYVDEVLILFQRVDEIRQEIKLGEHAVNVFQSFESELQLGLEKNDHKDFDSFIQSITTEAVSKLQDRDMRVENLLQICQIIQQKYHVQENEIIDLE